MDSNYSAESQQDAVKLAVESDQSVAKTARDLGVHANPLYTWISGRQHEFSLPLK